MPNRNTLKPLLLAIASAALLAACNDSAPANTLTLKAALETAQREHKIVMLHFEGSDWCDPCKQLDENVLATDAFAQWARDKVVRVDLDYPNAKPQSDALKKQNAEIAKTYQIEGFPTVILLNSDGKEIARQVGYGGESPAAFIAARNKEIAAAAK